MSPELLPDATRERHAQLDRRLHDVTWGLLLLMTGVIWLVPSSQIPKGGWLIGVAAPIGASAAQSTSSAPRLVL